MTTQTASNPATGFYPIVEAAKKLFEQSQDFRLEPEALDFSLVTDIEDTLANNLKLIHNPTPKELTALFQALDYIIQTHTSFLYPEKSEIADDFNDFLHQTALIISKIWDSYAKTTSQTARELLKMLTETKLRNPRAVFGAIRLYSNVLPPLEHYKETQD